MKAVFAGYEIQVPLNPNFACPNAVKRPVGPNLKLVKTMGPLPSIPIETTLRWMYEFPGQKP